MQHLTNTQNQTFPVSPSKTAVSRKPERKFSPQPFEQYLRLWHEHIAREQLKLRKLTEMSVTLHRRFRGLTLSDQCGRYGVRIETKGRWLDYDPELDGEIHPINIVQPAIRANTNACLQSNAEINIEAANASARIKKIADRWQKFVDYDERRNWTEQDRTILFDAIQKDGTILVHSYAKSAHPQKIPTVKEKDEYIASYDCNSCGSSGKKEIPMGADEKGIIGMQDVQCPNCEKPTKGMIKKLSSCDLDSRTVETKTLHHKLFSHYNFVIDSLGAKQDGIKSAKWLQIHEAVDRALMETEFPQFNFGSPSRWSYELQCDYALASAEFSRLNGSFYGGNSQDSLFDRFEKKTIYLHEDAYCNYVAPDDYEFVDGFGEKTFSIKRGETISGAQERQFGRNLEGIKFVFSCDRLRGVCSPDADELDFRKCFAAIHWLRDSSGFHSAPNISVAVIQDDITLLNTMNHNIIARNSVSQVYFDTTVFGESDFSQEYVGTDKAALMPDRNLRNGIFNLPIPQPSPHLSQQLQFMWGVKDTVSAVQPALRGEQQRGETYGAQRQQLEQSYGLLTAALKSFAQAKVTSSKQKALIAKNAWTLEQFQQVSAMYDEIWDDDDVNEMCAVDFDADLIWDYKQGSEMPSSNLSREMEFYQGLQQLTGLIQAGAQIDPDKMNKILERIDDNADFNFDLTGLEVDETIAQKRLKELTQIVAGYDRVSLDQIERARSEIIAMDEQGQPVSKLDAITEQIFGASKIRFSRYENLEQQGKHFTEALRIEIGADNPNYLLIEILTVTLAMLEQAIKDAATEAQANDPQQQAQQQQMQEQQKQLEEAKAADGAAQDKEFAQTMAGKEADHQAELEKIQLKHAQEVQQNQNQKENSE